MSENTDTLGSTLEAYFGEFVVDGVIEIPVSSAEERAEQDAKARARLEEQEKLDELMQRLNN